MTTPLVDNTTFFNGSYPGGFETIVTPCTLSGVATTHSYTCANGLNVTAMCSGQSNVGMYIYIHVYECIYTSVYTYVCIY
jgi:hypothetical protein